MMKIGEAANRLTRAELPSPRAISWSDAVGNRNWLIYLYDEVDREVAWSTIATSLPERSKALRPKLDAAARTIEPPSGGRMSRLGTS